MPIVVVVLVMVYVVACGAALIYLTTPMVLLALFGGTVVGVGGAVAAAALTLAGRRAEVTVIGPEEVAAGAIGGPERPGLPRRDRAWPTYFAAQVWHDLSAAVRWTGQLTLRCWTLTFNRTAYWSGELGIVLWAFWPLLLPIPVLLVATTVGAAAGVVIVTSVFAVTTAAAWVGGGLVVGLLRAVDRAWHWRFRSAPGCGGAGCYDVSRLPAFRCPNPDCGELHRDIRAGRLGVLWRRCRCGERMPTTLLRSTRLAAVCPRCTRPLYPGAGVLTDVRIPVFGASMAGKTRFMMAALSSLSDLAVRDGLVVTPGGPKDARVLAHYVDTITRQLPTAKSDRNLPEPVTVQLTAGRRTAMLHLFDAAGELFEDQQQNADLHYLDRARGLVFVLDPFSIPEVRVRMTAAGQGVPIAATADLEGAYQATVQRLRDHRVRTDRQRLAFVVSKADLLLGLSVATDLDPARADECVPPWLGDVGADNLVLAAGRDFRQVRYFLVSSMTADPRVPDGALAPLRWLLAGDRIVLGGGGGA